jgi:hypothetical protein
MKAKDSTGSEDNSLFYHVEDELRSSILQLSLLDVNMDRLPNCKSLYEMCYDALLSNIKNNMIFNSTFS